MNPKVTNMAVPKMSYLTTGQKLPPVNKHTKLVEQMTDCHCSDILRGFRGCMIMTSCLIGMEKSWKCVVKNVYEP